MSVLRATSWVLSLHSYRCPMELSPLLEMSCWLRVPSSNHSNRQVCSFDFIGWFPHGHAGAPRLEVQGDNTEGFMEEVKRSNLNWKKQEQVSPVAPIHRTWCFLDSSEAGPIPPLISHHMVWHSLLLRSLSYPGYKGESPGFTAVWAGRASI